MTNQRGSALFYILIAVALLAALTYAIARSSRGNVNQLSAEQSRLAATEMLEYANSVSSAVSQIKLRGVKETKLCFDDPQATEDYDYAGCSEDYNKIYSLSGGGLTWTKLPKDASTSANAADFEWHVYGDNEVKSVGTTCAGAACAELLLVASTLDKTVCSKLNELLSITDKDVDPPNDPGLGTAPYKGVYGYTNTIGITSVNGPFDGKPAGCFYNNTANSYTFYKVLIAR